MVLARLETIFNYTALSLLDYTLLRYHYSYLGREYLNVN